jgi:hypothetical protein
MSNLNEKITSLTEEISVLEKKTKNWKNITLAVYIVVVLFVFIYTTVIFGLIKAHLSADNISATGKNLISTKLEELRPQVINYAKENIPVLADYAVDTIKTDIIPSLENQIFLTLDIHSAKLIEVLTKEVLPQLRKSVDEQVKIAIKNENILKDKDAGKEIAHLIVNQANIEMNKLFDHKFAKAVFDLKQRLKVLATKKDSEITQKELSQRKVIVAWLYMVNNDKTPDKIVMDLFNDISIGYKNFSIK